MESTGPYRSNIINTIYYMYRTKGTFDISACASVEAVSCTQISLTLSVLTRSQPCNIVMSFSQMHCI